MYSGLQELVKSYPTQLVLCMIEFYWATFLDLEKVLTEDYKHPYHSPTSYILTNSADILKNIYTFFERETNAEIREREFPTGILSYNLVSCTIYIELEIMSLFLCNFST